MRKKRRNENLGLSWKEMRIYSTIFLYMHIFECAVNMMKHNLEIYSEMWISSQLRKHTKFVLFSFSLRSAFIYEMRQKSNGIQGIHTHTHSRTHTHINTQDCLSSLFFMYYLNFPGMSHFAADIHIWRKPNSLYWLSTRKVNKTFDSMTEWDG